MLSERSESAATVHLESDEEDNLPRMERAPSGLSEILTHPPQVPDQELRPTNHFVTPLLSDLYQLTMTYGYWKAGKHNDQSTFDLFFRKNPFHGEFTIFAGLEECIRFIKSFKFTEHDIKALRMRFDEWDAPFWDYLAGMDTSRVKVWALQEGSLAFPRVPLLRVEGPIAVCQLMETTLLVLVNYASLICTNAARHRLAAGPNKTLLEFGLRRAQGPDGGMSASRYSYMGGFDGTSNMAAGVKWSIPIRGTHAHSYVSSYVSLADLHNRTIVDVNGKKHDFVALCQQKLELLGATTNEGELAAFISYALAFNNGFLALVDTYDTLASGVPNFLAVALSLHELGFKPVGIRLDSGDLAFLSKGCRKQFIEASEKFDVPFQHLTIVASNDLCEEVIYSLNDQGHEIDSFGIGTHLVTCKSQPALGCVYKLVEINGAPRIKVSQDIIKVTIPGRKQAFRLFDAHGCPVADLLVLVGSQVPRAGKKVLCRHPFLEKKRVFVIPSRVESLHKLVWDGENGVAVSLPSIRELREKCQSQLSIMRRDHLRRLNPTPYKVSVSSELHSFIHELWYESVPVSVIS